MTLNELIAAFGREDLVTIVEGILESRVVKAPKAVRDQFLSELEASSDAVLQEILMDLRR